MLSVFEEFNKDLECKSGCEKSSRRYNQNALWGTSLVAQWLRICLPGVSMVAQWLRICLPMQGTRVRALVWEDPTCRGAAGPVSHNC